MKLLHNQSDELLHQLCKELPRVRAELDKALVPSAIFKAAKKGMIVFVTTILSARPELVRSSETRTQRNLFMCAVLHRQIDVFRLVYKYTEKNAILSTEDRDGNNILHMAAKLESSTGLRYIPGAALQMQRELQWYKVIPLTLYHFDILSLLICLQISRGFTVRIVKIAMFLPY